MIDKNAYFHAKVYKTEASLTTAFFSLDVNRIKVYTMDVSVNSMGTFWGNGKKVNHTIRSLRGIGLHKDLSKRAANMV